MYIKVVKLNEHYIFTDNHFQIHLTSFDKNWK